jgi:DNA helicase-2/ATP-dependent DNA helicase PcrA
MMIRKIVRKNRFMGVGDENQSIYAFRGAHQNSMELLREEFECRRFDLSISFRCPKNVVLEARTRAPRMMWPEWAKDGEVIHLPKWSAESLPQDCTILCRNNSPLFGAATKLLKNGKFPTLQGNDIGRKLIKIMAKLGAPSTPKEDVYKLLDEWKEKRLKSSRAPESIHDQVDCMKIFVDEAATLNQACIYAEHLMTISGNIQMMTAHKSKGLEWNTVYLLDRELMRTDKSTQERNLLYVAQTRAKESLTYIRSDGFEGV